MPRKCLCRLGLTDLAGGVGAAFRRTRLGHPARWMYPGMRSSHRRVVVAPIFPNPSASTPTLPSRFVAAGALFSDSSLRQRHTVDLPDLSNPTPAGEPIRGPWLVAVRCLTQPSSRGRYAPAIGYQREVAEASAITDYGLIADCGSAALVSKAGSIDWCCVPRLDRGSCFGRILDPTAGHFSISPIGHVDQIERSYVPETMVLRTTFTTSDGTIDLTDFFVLPSPADDRGGSTLMRIVEAKEGKHRIELELAPRFDYGEVDPWIRVHAPRLYSAIGGDDGLVISSDTELELDRHSLGATVEVAQGEKYRFAIESRSPERIDAAPLASRAAEEIDECLEATVAALVVLVGGDAVRRA